MGKKELTDQQLSAPAINFLDAVLPLEEKIQKYIFKGSLQNQMLRHIGLMALICETNIQRRDWRPYKSCKRDRD